MMSPMMNMYEELRGGLQFNKFVVGELLFVEYKCPIEEESCGVWAPTDYFVHVLSGKKTWRTTQGSWTAEMGQTLYFKKGAAIVDQYFDEDFCIMGFFISDEFVREVVREVAGQLSNVAIREEANEPAIMIKTDVRLAAYFQSMLAYFAGTEKPSDPLLLLKLKELIVNILAGSDNPALASYFRSLSTREGPSLQRIMEANFCYNLSLEEYAKLCHRSLTSFKRDFQKVYKIPPGRWLIQKRLEYSAVLLRNKDLNISQIGFECGFEDLSHFSRAFKDRFGTSPVNYRKEAGQSGAKPA